MKELHKLMTIQTMVWEDWDLFRVWDSCELEDEEKTVREWGVRNEGTLDNSEAAKGLLYLGLI